MVIGSVKERKLLMLLQSTPLVRAQELNKRFFAQEPTPCKFKTFLQPEVVVCITNTEIPFYSSIEIHI